MNQPMSGLIFGLASWLKDRKKIFGRGRPKGEFATGVTGVRATAGVVPVRTKEVFGTGNISTIL